MTFTVSLPENLTDQQWLLAASVAWYVLAGIVFRWSGLGRKIYNAEDEIEIPGAGLVFFAWALSPALFTVAAALSALLGSIWLVSWMLTGKR